MTARTRSRRRLALLAIPLAGLTGLALPAAHAATRTGTVSPAGTWLCLSEDTTHLGICLDSPFPRLGS